MSGALPVQTEQMEPCPFCFGRGSNGGYTCGFCNGAGQVDAVSAAQGRHVMSGGSVDDFYPSLDDDFDAYPSSGGGRSRVCPTVTVQPGVLCAGGLEKLHTMDILHLVIIVIQMDVVRNAWVKD